MQSVRRGRIWQNFILLLFSTLFSLIALELGVRCVRGKILDTSLLSVVLRENEGESEQAKRYDSYLGWVPNPGTRVMEGWNETNLEEGIRSNGINRPTSFVSDHVILATGDSFTHGTAAEDHETWPAYLESFSRTQVINGGVGAYGLDQSVLRTELLASEYQPSLVVVSFIPDDIQRCRMSVHGQAKPYFIVDGDQLVLQNVPVPLPEGEEAREPDWFRGVFGYSHLVDFIMRRVAFYYWLDHRVILAGFRGKTRSPGDDSAGSIGCLLMRHLAQLRDQRDVEIVVLAQYTKSLRPDYHEKSLFVLDCARKEGLHVLDLYDAMSDARQSDPKRYNGLFRGHMTGKGNEFVAKELMRFLEAQGLLTK